MTTPPLLTPSAVTIGTSGLGEPTPDGGAQVPPSQTEVELAMAMLRSPHTLVDTSNMYALGRSERALGAAIDRLGGVPAGHQVISKADRDLATGAFDRDRVWRSFEESTARLGVDRLPLYQLHDPYTVTVPEAMGPGGAVDGLIELRDQGLVGAIGVAAGPVDLLTAYVRTGVFDVLLTHNRYTLVDRSAADLVAESADRGMLVLNAAPFGGGLLAEGARNRTHYGYRPAAPALLSWLDRLRAVCRRHGVSTSAVALLFSVRDPAIHSTVVGVSSVERLGQLDELLAAEVPDEIWAQIAALGAPPSPLGD
jgi:D-threo-aldose 1-dehydrogenase